MGQFKIKNATNFMLKTIDSDRCIKLNLNDCKLDTYDFDMSFTFKSIKYNITINNIPCKYVNNNPELVGEYCKNIIYKLAEENHEFVNGEFIDFQKYLV